MIGNLARFFSDDGFMPHGMCYLWRPGILSLHVVSDAIIALAYASIPFTLVYFVRKRKDLEFSWMFVCFAVFIVACGTTHVLEIWVIWHPTYWLSGIVKAITAMASLPTAILLIKLIPAALRVPSQNTLKATNDALDLEIVERRRAQLEVQRMNQELESRVAQRTQELETVNWNLRKSQELLHSIMQNSSAVIYIKEASGRYLLINDRYQELFHVTQEWMLSKTDYDIFPKEIADTLRATDEKALASSKPLQIEELVPQDDGIHTYISIKCRLLDADGRPYAICGVSTDMTEHKRAEAQFRLALEAAPTGMLLIDQKGLIVLVNRQIEELFGYTREELINTPVESLVPDRFRSHHSALRSGFFATPQSRSMGAGRDLSGCRKDGSEFPLEIGLNPVTTNDGPCVIASVTDLTKRKAAAAMGEQMARTQAHLAAIVESSEDAIIGNDVSGYVTSWNAGAQALFGYTADEMIGKSIAVIIPADRREEGDLMNDTAGVDHHYNQFDSVRRAKDGRLIDVSITVSPIKDSQGIVIGVSKVARDISDRVRSVAELRARSEDLARSNAELEQFAYSASHDLQEPLRAVAGCVQLLRKRYGGQLDARADEYVDNAVDGAKRMQELIGDLLAYSRVGAQKAEITIVDCNDVVRRAKANLQAAIEESNAVIECDNLPALSGDRTQLLQLFQNLIGNAIKFRRNMPPIVRIGCEQSNDEFVFAVSDNGIGIEERHTKRIFGVFQRLHTRADYAGTGIGLALCAKIAAGHRGRIWVESQFGVGTTFYVALPKKVEG